MVDDHQEIRVALDEVVDGGQVLWPHQRIEAEPGAFEPGKERPRGDVHDPSRLAVREHGAQTDQRALRTQCFGVRNGVG